MGKKREVLRVILLTLAFWALVLFGPALVMLWNALQPLYGRYQPGDLGYLILKTVSQGIACWLAFCAATSIGEDRHNVAVFVNSVVAATLLGFLCGYELFAYRWADGIALLVGMVVSIITAYTVAKDIREANEQKKSNSDTAAKELIERLAKKSGMSADEYIRSVRVAEKQADGMSEDEAKKSVELEDQSRT